MILSLFKQLVYVVVGFWLPWVFYLAVMSLYRARREGTLTRPATIMGYPVLVVGAIMDVLLNVVVLTVVMLEVPKELMVTHRLRRHKDGKGFRGRIARWLAKNFLDPYDPKGAHV